uniref:Uncharacterized protein n=1 Tax=Myoviridae sp. ct0jJ30 TaxID=2825014 RepID=A0A8S5PIH5_9CAUD|nr:MAG TPA: hypothetical protein [Myoviridae sp. ct0jJ30]
MLVILEKKKHSLQIITHLLLLEVIAEHLRRIILVRLLHGHGLRMVDQKDLQQDLIIAL